MSRSTMKRKHNAWWTVGDDEMPQEIATRVQYIATQNNEMRLDNAMYLSIGSNGNVDGSGAFGSETTQYRMMGLKMRKNLVQALIDTAASLIASNRTMPSYQTVNGDFTLQQKAKQRADVIHAQMWQLGAFELGIDAFYDAAHVGTGITHGLRDPVTGMPRLVRVMPNSLLTDLAEGRNPRSIYWTHFVNRDYLAKIYPKFRHEIEAANGPTSDDYETYWLREDNKADLVKVVEAWHLPSTPESNDGKHVITVSNKVLSASKYFRQRFPFAFYHYARRRAGFWGQGIVERALPSQIRHWQLQQVIDRCQDLGSNLVFLVEENSGVFVDEISNLPGTPISYRGQAPQAVMWQGTPQDLRAEQQTIWADLLEQEGLSQGVTGGELPQKGLSSGRAVRAADDVTSRRQVIPTRAFEAYYLQVAQLIADLNDDCVENDPKYAVSGYSRAGRQTFLASSKWAELDIPEGDVHLTVFSMSAQPTTPAAKMQAVTEYTEAGYMSKAQAISLLEFPDIDAWEQLETANEDLVNAQIEQLRKGIPELPIPQQDLQLAKKTALNAFLIAYRSKAPMEVLDAFQGYDRYCDILIERAMAASAPPPDDGTQPAEPQQTDAGAMPAGAMA